MGSMGSCRSPFWGADYSLDTPYYDGYTKCADEWGSCGPTSAGGLVMYGDEGPDVHGLDGKYYIKKIGAGQSIECTNEAFCGDPVFGVQKSCYC